MGMKKAIIATVTALFIVAGCGGDDGGANNGEATNNGGGKGDFVQNEAKLCAAVRGNGQLITAHFGALARIVEHYGLFWGVSGGSSASITSFMLSSMQSNPQVLDCAYDSCDARERATRTALLLKSFVGYVEVLSQTEEALAAQALAPVAAEIQNQGIEAMLDDDPDAAVSALQTILESDDVRALINPEVLDLLKTSPNPEFHARDIVGAVQNFGSFSADNPLILIRPGVLNFEALAGRLGIAASFYAGYGPYDGEAMEAWFEACAERTRGMTWREASTVEAGEATCGEMFHAMAGQYREAFKAADDPQNRADDRVGSLMPALISTSVLTGDGVDAFDSARQQYLNAESPELTVDFDDVKFGYFGSQEALEAAAANENGYDDLKTQKFLSLGQKTWAEALSYSPAEPGLSRAKALPGGDISAGGWSDLHPTLVLQNLGCDEVVYVTRTDEESQFAEGVARLLGMTDADREALYDLENPASSFSLSIAESDGVWCTDWNSFDGLNLDPIFADAYNAPFVTTDDVFTDDGAYDDVVSGTDRLGCGASAATR